MTQTQTQKINLQDAFLAAARRSEIPVTAFLVNGFQMRGIITGFFLFPPPFCFQKLFY